VDNLEFYIPLYNQGKLEFYNIFRHSGVRWGLSMYRTGKFDKVYPDGEGDRCLYVFGDFWARTEYEMIISEWGGDASRKVDMFELCIKPNEKLLFEMIESVPLEECEKFLTEWYRKRRK